MDWITESAVRDYLDAVVAIKVEEVKVKKLGQIELILFPNQVHIHRGITEMAEAAGCELKEELHSDREGYPFEYFFKYKGIRFFQMEQERMAGYEDV